MGKRMNENIMSELSYLDSMIYGKTISGDRKGRALILRRALRDYILEEMNKMLKYKIKLLIKIKMCCIRNEKGQIFDI